MDKVTGGDYIAAWRQAWQAYLARVRAPVSAENGNDFQVGPVPTMGPQGKGRVM